VLGDSFGGIGPKTQLELASTENLKVNRGLVRKHRIWDAVTLIAAQGPNCAQVKVSATFRKTTVPTIPQNYGPKTRTHPKSNKSKLL